MWYQRTVKKFKHLANLDPQDVVLLITGSGTAAIESVISGIQGSMGVATDGEFSGRIGRTIEHYSKESDKPEHLWHVQYETAESKLNDIQPNKHGLTLVDCVSSFPYYDVPECADVWVTVNSKQLGGIPILGIVVLKKRALDYLAPPTPTYLSLARHFEYYTANRQTPNTPAIPAIIDLYDALSHFDLSAFRHKIKDRQEAAQSALGPPIGEGPVLTYTPQRIHPMAIEQWRLYVTKAGNPQLFLWSGSDVQYSRFFAVNTHHHSYAT